MRTFVSARSATLKILSATAMVGLVVGCGDGFDIDVTTLDAISAAGVGSATHGTTASRGGRPLVSGVSGVGEAPLVFCLRIDTARRFI